MALSGKGAPSIVLSCLLWEKQWTGMAAAAVEVLNGGCSKDEVMMHLV